MKNFARWIRHSFRFYFLEEANCRFIAALMSFSGNSTFYFQALLLIVVLTFCLKAPLKQLLFRRKRLERKCSTGND